MAKKSPILDVAKVARQVRSGERVRLVLRSTLYQPVKNRNKFDSPKERKRHSKYTYTTNIDRGNLKIKSRFTYIDVTKEDLNNLPKLEDRIESRLHTQFTKFKKSKFNTFTYSAQFIRGTVVDKYRARFTADSKATKVAYFPAMSKKTKRTHKKERKAVTLNRIQGNNLIDMLDAFEENMALGFTNISVHRGKKRKKSVRAQKHEGEEDE